MEKGLIGSENWTPEKALLWAETQRLGDGRRQQIGV
jgi:hypothetical protein